MSDLRSIVVNLEEERENLRKVLSHVNAAIANARASLGEELDA